MNDWFIWNGARSTEYGMHVLELPPPTIPAERVTFTNVPGRPGSLTTLEGEDVYEDLVLTAQCVLPDPTKIPAIAAWLRGSGTVTFANRQGGFYYARVVNQIPFEKILRGNPHRSFAVNFRCKPFWYADAGTPVTLTQSGTFVSNPGSVYAEPGHHRLRLRQHYSHGGHDHRRTGRVSPEASHWIRSCRKPTPA